MQPRRVVSGIAAAKVLGGVRMRFVKLPLLLACTTALIAIAQAQVPARYPADYAKILDGAKKEGKVVVYSTTDAKLVQPLIKDFEAAVPGGTVATNHTRSHEDSNRYIRE